MKKKYFQSLFIVIDFPLDLKRKRNEEEKEKHNGPIYILSFSGSDLFDDDDCHLSNQSNIYSSSVHE